MELAWMDTYVWEKLWLHSATQWYTCVNMEWTRTRVFRTTQCSSCEDNYEIGQQWQWKQQCTQWCCTLTLKRTFHDNGDNSIENSHFGDKIMKHLWQQHSVSTLLPEEMKSWTTCGSNNAHLQRCNYETSMTTMTLSMQLWDNGDNDKLEVAIMRKFVTSMNSNNTLWRWNLMKHWLLWLNKFI